MIKPVLKQTNYNPLAVNARTFDYRDPYRRKSVVEKESEQELKNIKTKDIAFLKWTLNALESEIINVNSTISPLISFVETPLLSVIKKDIRIQINHGSLALLERINLIGDDHVVQARISKIRLLKNNEVTCVNQALEGDLVILTLFIPFRFIAHLKNINLICKIHSVFDN